MMKDMTIATIMVEGARIAILSIIMYAFWIFVTSVVSLVTRLDVEKWSMLEKEKVWMLSCMALRRFLASPAPARAAKKPPIMPVARPVRATMIISAPVRMMKPTSPAITPRSTILPIRMGMIISQMTSPIIQTGVRMETRRNSLTCDNIVLIIKNPFIVPEDDLLHRNSAYSEKKII